MQGSEKKGIKTVNAWYQVLSMGFGYISVAIILVIIILALRIWMQDRKRYRRVKKAFPQTGNAGYFEIMEGRGRLQSGMKIPVSYEGILGAAPGCDICLPMRGIHLRSAFFWVEDAQLHLVPIRNDVLKTDGQRIKPGDEAVLREGARLEVSGLGMKLHLNAGHTAHAPQDPYVTRERRKIARSEKGNAIGDGGVSAEKTMKRTRKRLVRPGENAQGSAEKKKGKKEGERHAEKKKARSGKN